METLTLIEPDDDVAAELSSRFDVYNARHAPWRIETFSYALRRDDALVAGGRAVVNMGAVEIRSLWVDEALRGRGIGSRVMTALEEEAKRRGAARATLYTFSWQAQPFYEGLGYRVYARFSYPDGPERIDMMKDL